MTSRSFSRGRSTTRAPESLAAAIRCARPVTPRIFPCNVISPVTATSLRTFRCVNAETIPMAKASPADDPSLCISPWRARTERSLPLLPPLHIAFKRIAVFSNFIRHPIPYKISCPAFCPCSKLIIRDVSFSGHNCNIGKFIFIHLTGTQCCAVVDLLDLQQFP